MTAAVARDPRRSLMTGAIIAAVVLLVLAVMVVIGVYVVFEPRP